MLSNSKTQAQQEQQIEDIIRPIKKAPKIRSDHDISLIQEKTSQIPFFQKYIQENKSDVHLKCCKHMTYEMFEHSTFVFQQGDKGSKFYIILQGIVGIYIKIKNELKKVKELKIGESFGELALVNDSPRSASIKCLVDCHFAVLDKKNYIILFQQILDEEIKREISFYPEIELFSSWNYNKIKSFYNHSFRLLVKKGDKIINEGDSIDAIYIIASGEFLVKLNGNIHFTLHSLIQVKKTRVEQDEDQKKKSDLNKLRRLGLVPISVQQHHNKTSLFIMTHYEIFGQEGVETDSKQFQYSVECQSFEGNLIYIKLQDYMKIIYKDEAQREYMKNYSNSRLQRVKERINEIHQVQLMNVKKETDQIKPIEATPSQQAEFQIFGDNNHELDKPQFEVYTPILNSKKAKNKKSSIIDIIAASPHVISSNDNSNSNDKKQRNLRQLHLFQGLDANNSNSNNMTNSINTPSAMISSQYNSSQPDDTHKSPLNPQQLNLNVDIIDSPSDVHSSSKPVISKNGILSKLVLPGLQHSLKSSPNLGFVQNELSNKEGDLFLKQLKLSDQNSQTNLTDSFKRSQFHQGYLSASKSSILQPFIQQQNKIEPLSTKIRASKFFDASLSNDIITESTKNQEDFDFVSPKENTNQDIPTKTKKIKSFLFLKESSTLQFNKILDKNSIDSQQFNESIQEFNDEDGIGIMQSQTTNKNNIKDKVTDFESYQNNAKMQKDQQYHSSQQDIINLDGYHNKDMNNNNNNNYYNNNNYNNNNNIYNNNNNNNNNSNNNPPEEKLHPLVKGFHEQLKIRFYNKFKNGQIEDLKSHISESPIQSLYPFKREGENEKFVTSKKNKESQIKELRDYEQKLRMIIKQEGTQSQLQSISPLHPKKLKNQASKGNLTHNLGNLSNSQQQFNLQLQQNIIQFDKQPSLDDIPGESKKKLNDNLKKLLTQTSEEQFSKKPLSRQSQNHSQARLSLFIEQLSPTSKQEFTSSTRLQLYKTMNKLGSMKDVLDLSQHRSKSQKYSIEGFEPIIPPKTNSQINDNYFGNQYHEKYPLNKTSSSLTHTRISSLDGNNHFSMTDLKQYQKLSGQDSQDSNQRLNTDPTKGIYVYNFSKNSHQIFSLRKKSKQNRPYNLQLLSNDFDQHQTVSPIIKTTTALDRITSNNNNFNQNIQANSKNSHYIHSSTSSSKLQIKSSTQLSLSTTQNTLPSKIINCTSPPKTCSSGFRGSKGFNLSQFKMRKDKKSNPS